MDFYTCHRKAVYENGQPRRAVWSVQPILQREKTIRTFWELHRPSGVKTI